ncbi:MAG: cyclase family protein [Candidatus Glassbacteria bacterium]|nr:cyclase family protein [Candidatus Glassbacteria bacterium]
MTGFPNYADLNRPDDSGLPLAWGAWGAEDQLGTLNHITPEAVRAAAALVRRGVRFNLDLPLHVPYALTKPKSHRFRTAPRHTINEITATGALVGRDDLLDSFYLQGSSQWDGLTHIGDPRHGFYNGVRADQITGKEGTRNGIEQVAEFGMAGRCVLADLSRHFARTGRDWHPNRQMVVTPTEVEECLAAQGVTLQAGDILLVRYGWLEAFLAGGDEEGRDAVLRPWSFSGLSGGEDTWEFIWDNRIAAVASDSVTTEVWPLVEGKPSLHLAIARLGITIGELFDLEALAEDSADNGEYTAFFTSSPLNLRGGVGSPPNAMAIR